MSAVGVSKLLTRSAPTICLTIWASRYQGSCAAESISSIDAPSLKWFGLQRLLATGGLGSRLMETSLVHSHLGRRGAYELLAERVDPSKRLMRIASRYRAVELFGCPQDIHRAVLQLPSGFRLAAEGTGFAILTR
jgi:hypothetical protein